MDIANYGSYNLYTWTHDNLMRVLTQGSSKILQDPLIINAFKSIKREDFVPENQKQYAYSDKSIEIGHDQIIPHPTTVAKMVQLLRPREGKKYLDIGTGSGYTAAVLGFIAGDMGKVYSLERNQYIVEMARNKVKKYPNLAGRVEVIFKDGAQGYADKAPFDFVYCEASFNEVPNILKSQLVVGGRLVASTSEQEIIVIERVSPSEFDERKVGDSYYQIFSKELNN